MKLNSLSPTSISRLVIMKLVGINGQSTNQRSKKPSQERIRIADLALITFDFIHANIQIMYILLILFKIPLVGI